MPVPTVSIPELSLGGPKRRVAGGPITMREVKLGRLPPKAVPGALDLANYLREGIAVAPPVSVDHAANAPRVIARMYANDRYGDCVIAEKYHHLGVQHATDSPAEPPVEMMVEDSEVIRVYKDWCGPGDNGCYISSVLDQMKTRGLPFDGKPHVIDGWVRVDPANVDAVKAAIYLFGGVSIGLNYLAAWQRESVPGGIWDNVSSSSLGGHDVGGFGYDERAVAISTWGYMCWLTWSAMKNPRIVDECYVILGKDWYQDDRLSPAGLSVEQLRADLAVLGGGGVPPMPEPKPPVPPKPPEPPVPPKPPEPHPTLAIVLTGSVLIDGEACPITMSGSAGSLATAIGDEVVIDLQALGVPEVHAEGVARRLGMLFDRPGREPFLLVSGCRLEAKRPDNVLPGQWWQIIQIIIAVIQQIVDVLGGG